MLSKYFDYLSIALLAGGLAFLYHQFNTSQNHQIEVHYPEIKEEIKSLNRFGYDETQYYISEQPIKKNQFLGDILTSHGIDYKWIAELEHKAKDIFSVRKLRAGKNYTIVKNDSLSTLKCFIYEPDPFRYVVYDFTDSVDVRMIEREVSSCIETASGTLTSSLWNSMIEQDLNVALISRMEDALAWSIDFYHTQVGDSYKLMYEELYVDGKPTSVGRLLGAYYKNYGNEYYAIYYENEEYKGFYDLEGRATKKDFLKSPVAFSRISSRFNLNRFHPIKKRRIPHLGTDYAAPYGTPIRAVANGVVTKASYTKGNGRYVKIKHDAKYSTQYLHMQKFGKGIRSGAHVKQGQTIGYVGSTGLATGPHVCFRFWKNGRQINHMRENFPPPAPMSKEDLPAYFTKRDEIVKTLDILPVSPSVIKKASLLISLDSIQSEP
jgi:murein DD-endopeptidase MepM/ murein hydrolase activator NlpD